MPKINTNSAPKLEKKTKIQRATRPNAAHKYKIRIHPFITGVDDKLFKLKSNNQVTVLTTNDTIKNLQKEVLPPTSGNTDFKSVWFKYNKNGHTLRKSNQG